METAASFFRGPIPPLPAEFADLPPLAVGRIQWRRAARALRKLLADPQRTELVFEVFEALGGDDECQFRHFAASPEGRRLLTERPCLTRLLADRDALRKLPGDSFGRAYLAFCETNGFAADGLLKAREKAGIAPQADVSSARAWFADRVTMMHDLWHILTGYGTDDTGEVALLAFSRSQGLRGRPARFFSALAALRNDRAARRIVRDARRRGRAALPLILAGYEELLPLPLERVRKRLRIAAPAPSGRAVGRRSARLLLIASAVAVLGAAGAVPIARAGLDRRCGASGDQPQEAAAAVLAAERARQQVALRRAIEDRVARRYLSLSRTIRERSVRPTHGARLAVRASPSPSR